MAMNENSTILCSVCGTAVRASARYCTNCGAPLAGGHPPAQLPSPPAAPQLPLSEQPTLRRRPSDAPPNAIEDAPPAAAPPPSPADAPTLTGMQAAQRRALRQTSGTATHVGRVRDRNEDYVAKLDYSLDQSGEAEPMGLYIVADGMGGYQEGEKASRDSVRRAFREFIEGRILHDLQQTTTRKLDAPTAPLPPDQTIRSLVEEANRLVYRKRQQLGSNRGTTIAALLIIGDKAAVANVGDSRTYLLRDDRLGQISQDHSLVYSLFKAGQITEEQIYTHPQKNEIYRSVGEREDVKVDVFKLNVQAGDRLLLCSDGLWEMVRNAQIATILGGAATPQSACDQLVAAAYDNGGEDNISAIAVYLE
jgi:protein phosphatase